MRITHIKVPERKFLAGYFWVLCCVALPQFEGKTLDAEQKHCSMTGMHFVCFRFVHILRCVFFSRRPEMLLLRTQWLVFSYKL